ncbi:hypothetical protein JOJ87_001441 [Rhodococcus ruber]|uniref:hypothetical protein n=1 Tax=Rhodococcus TaxID=1827 RepID=UPI001AE8E512|nr:MULTISPECIES: hypothetical protein [Rhodococcus]MBP2211097.1 hypothetical protein [Rhodococcus ruber]UGQ39390.1 hypothetical protein LRQ66_14330 [Rhodococcus aetherivorans]
MGVRVYVEIAGDQQRFDFPDSPGWHIDDLHGRLHVRQGGGLGGNVAAFDDWVAVVRSYEDEAA